MADNLNERREVVGDPNLDPKLRARAEAASAAVPVVLEAAAQLRHDDTLAQMQAIALHGTIIELFSACVLLAQWGEPTAIPILLRSEYEALVDLDNLVRDADYVDRMAAANIAQTLKIMKGTALRKEFQVGRKAEPFQSVVIWSNETKYLRDFCVSQMCFVVLCSDFWGFCNGHPANKVN